MRDLSLLTWKEVKEIDKSKSIVFIVLAPIEEHGTHLPLHIGFWKITGKVRRKKVSA